MINKVTIAAARVAAGIQNCLYVNDLSALIAWANDIKLPNDEAETITIRELIKIGFAELGIEIEFSGKNDHEKGVIIDVDEDKVIALGLSNDALKFGQTVVRAGTDRFKATAVDQLPDDFDPGEKLELISGFSLDKVIKEQIEEALKLIKLTPNHRVKH